MSMIESLLLISTDSVDNKIKTDKIKGNFLLELLQSYKEEPQKVTDLLKSLNIKEEDLDKLFSNNDNEELKDLIKTIKDLISNNQPESIEVKKEDIDKFTVSNKHQKVVKNNKVVKNSKIDNDEKNIIKLLTSETFISNDKLEKKISNFIEKQKLSSQNEQNSSKLENKLDNKTQNDSILQALLNEQTIIDNDKNPTTIKNNKILSKKTKKKISFITNDNNDSKVININTKVNKKVSKLEEKIVEVTKKIITSQNTLQNLKLSQKEIEKFKNIKTFKELIEFANKKELNVSKIVLSYTQKKQKQKQIQVQTHQILMPKHKIELNTRKKSINQIVLKNQNNINNNNTNKNIFLFEIIKNSTPKKEIKQNTKNQPIQTVIKNQNNNKNILSEIIKNSTPKKEIKQNTKNQPIQTVIKNQNNINNNNTNNTNQDIFSETMQEITKTNTNNETLNTENKEQIKTTPNHANTSSLFQIDVDSLKQNIHKARESLRHFSSNLKEAIDNYKPPISKLSMELHPKELGKVEVTIVHRGDNLQIQISSNNTAVGFLHSQQQELRQNLVNMGFSDVNMSFNSQQQGNKEYKQNQKFANNNNDEEDELIIEIPYQYA